MYSADFNDITINTGGLKGLYGPSAVGGEIYLNSKKLKKGFQAFFDATATNNENLTNTQISYKNKSYDIKLSANLIDQTAFDISKDAPVTSIQPNTSRLNSDKHQVNTALRANFYLNSHDTLGVKISHHKSHFGNPVQIFDEPSNAFGSNADYTRTDHKELSSYWIFFDHKKGDNTFSLRTYYDDYEDLWNFYKTTAFDAYKFDPSTYEDSRLGLITSQSFAYSSKQKAKIALNVEENKHAAIVENNSTIKRYATIDYALSYEHDYNFNKSSSITATGRFKRQNLTEVFQFPNKYVAYDDNQAFDMQLIYNYKVGKDLYYISLADKTRFAALRELYPFFPWDTANNNVRPEKSKNIEIGATLKVQDKTSIKSALFSNHINDLITYESDKFQNIEKSSIQGVEFSVRKTASATHLLEFSYTYTKAVDHNDNDLIKIPRTKAFASDTITFTDTTSLAVEALYTGSRYDSYNSKRYKLSDYTLINAQIVHELSKNASIKTGVKNITDTYWSFSYGQPAQGRSYFFTFKYKL